MKTLCITGNTAFSLASVTDILTAVGMQQALPSRQDATLTMQAWHDRICSAHPPSESELQIDTPGIFWNQMAGDIFLANYNSALWGWSSPGSVRLLEYWLAFDPTILFLMVYTDPVTALAEAISSEAPQDDSMDFLSGWQASTKEMLRIYNRHPERCMLLDYRQFCAAPAALTQLCSQRWGLTLDSSAATPLSGMKIPDPLPCYLAHASLQGHPEIQELQREIESSYTRLPSGETVPADHAAPPLAAVVDEYRSLLATKVRGTQQLETLQNQQSLLEASREELADLRQQLKLIKKQEQTLSEENERIFKSEQALQSMLEDSNTDLAGLHQQLNLAKEQEKNVSEENELLILQLHQVQEELEHYFLQHQQLQQQNRQMEARWQRMLERQPEYTDYTDITVDQDPADAASQKARWKISNLEVAGRCYDRLDFNTVLVHELCGIQLKRDSLDDPAPLLRWPLTAVSETELLLLPAGTMEEILPRVETLFELSTADWDLVNSLQRLMVSALQRHDLELPTGLQASQLETALENLRIRMIKLPPVFRYNKLTLKRSQVNPDYEHLWLQFEGVSFADRRWPKFEFRFSCADVRPDSFGDLPKFEFPQGAGQAPLENWFAESSDDFGPKFELRFNLLTSAMDMAVWKRLSSSDQEFVKGLAARLGKIVGDLQLSGAELARPWQQWTSMAEKVGRLLFTLTTPPAQGSRQ